MVLGVDPRDPYQRAMVEGVIAFTHGSGGWEILLAPERETLSAHLREPDPPDGVIAEYRLADRDELAAAGVPTVMLLYETPSPRFSLVTDDEDAVAAMALEYLRECGLRRFAFLDHDFPPSPRRLAFAAAVSMAGLECHAYPPVGAPLVHGWNAQTQAIGDWVGSLPTPIGVLCFRVSEAQQLAMACRRRGIAVPEDVAILSTNGDDVECHLATPPLSAIDLGGERLGRAAAERLSEMMAGGSLAPTFRKLPPTGITRRQSTDLRAADDPNVAAAMALIRDHACDGITVREVADKSELSRRRLDYAFKHAIGRTLHEQILHERFDAARRMLIRTRLPLTEIAMRCGYAYPTRLSEAFRRELGVTPTRFREEHQAPL